MSSKLSLHKITGGLKPRPVLMKIRINQPYLHLGFCRQLYLINKIFLY